MVVDSPPGVSYHAGIPALPEFPVGAVKDRCQLPKLRFRQTLHMRRVYQSIRSRNSGWSAAPGAYVSGRPECAAAGVPMNLEGRLK